MDGRIDGCSGGKTVYASEGKSTGARLCILLAEIERCILSGESATDGAISGEQHHIV